MPPVYKLSQLTCQGAAPGGSLLLLFLVPGIMVEQ